MSDYVGILARGTPAFRAVSAKNPTPVSHLDQFTHVWVNVDGNGWRLARLYCSTPIIRPDSKK
jgi:hypothetical protein